MPSTDPSSSDPWLASLRGSRARRAESVRRRRQARGRRGVLAVMGASLALAGGAIAEAASSSGTGGTSTAAPASGATGVAALQRALGIEADGIYGPKTRRAVRRFQRAHGLAVDGIAGPRTLAALGVGATAAVKVSGPGSDPVLQQIARCESGGNPRAISADGRYRGKYQFSRATWRAMGGKGDPAKAAESVQDRIAAALFAASGTSPWPNCA